MSRFVVVVSDIHAGSSVAVCPPDFVCDDGQEVRLSDAQRALWAQWRLFWDEFVPRVTGGEDYAVVINGDVTEGNHHKAVQTISENESDHIRAAVELLQPVRDKAAKLYIVRGTEAHVGPSGGLEEQVARQVRADSDGPIKSHWQLWMDLGPHLIHCSHHVGTTSSTSYEHSALSRELAANLLESAQWGERPADVIVRSHRHRYSTATLPTSRGTAEVIVTPAWQLRTAFAWKKVSMRLPQVGGVVLGYDEWGLFTRRMVWVPPRQGVIPLTVDAAKRQLSTGQTSAPRSRSTTKVALRPPNSRGRGASRTGRR